MKVEYFEKIDANWKVIRPVAYFVMIPDGYPGTKKWPWEMAIHGVGEWSNGSIENLKNLEGGFDYDGDGQRDDGPPFATADMKKAVDQYGIILVVPTYESNTFLEPSQINYVYDQIKAKYSVVDKMLLTGFSYGGGATAKYISSSAANAARVAYAVPCAATNHLQDASIVAKAGLPVHFFSNDKDDRVSVSNTNAMYDKIIAANPVIKPLKTIFRRDGHGSNIEAWSLTPPKAPGGQGFTDAAENIYEVYLSILANGPRQMKAGSVTTPVPEPSPIPTPTAKPVTSYTLNGNIATLDGSKSTGYVTGLDGKWEFVGGPSGVQSWDVFKKGSNYITAEATLPKQGTYVFRFILKGADPVNLTVTSGRTVTGYDPVTGLLSYSDGSTEKVTVVAVKTATGEVVQL